MNREEILQASRKENQNRDLPEKELLYLAGSHSARVGALLCCVATLLGSVLARRVLYGPWAIYFGMMPTQWLVRFLKQKRKTDLVVALLFFALSAAAFVGLVRRLWEGGPGRRS